MFNKVLWNLNTVRLSDMLVTLNLTSLPSMSAVYVAKPVAELDTEPNVAIKASVPSCVTLASTISCLPLVASTAEM